MLICQRVINIYQPFKIATKKTMATHPCSRIPMAFSLLGLLVVGGRQVCRPHAADLLRAPHENLGIESMYPRVNMGKLTLDYHKMWKNHGFPKQQSRNGKCSTSMAKFSPGYLETLLWSWFLQKMARNKCSSSPNLVQLVVSTPLKNISQLG